MSSATTYPLISIGMPVRNEARFLEETLTSLLKQQGTNVELIISDNASEDETQAICLKFCAEYPNIRYHRFDDNQGSRANFSYVLDQATGKYFIWASGHDLWQHNYLQTCCAALESDNEAVLAIGSTNWIDDIGQPLPRRTGWTDTKGMGNIARYLSVFWGNMNPVLGLIRREAVANIHIRDLVGADLLILLVLACKGDFVHVPETRWYRRDFRNEATYQQKLQRYGNRNFGLGMSFFSRLFPLAALPFAIVVDLFRSGMHWLEKTGLLLILLLSFPIKYLADRFR